MSRIELTDLPVSVELSDEEMVATSGSGPHVRVLDGSTGLTSNLGISGGGSEPLIGLLLPAVQKVRE